MSTLADLGDYLEDEGLGVLASTLFLGSQPDDPDQILSVAQYPGNPPAYVQDSDTPTRERPQIHVAARAVKFEDADDLAMRAWLALSRVHNTIINSVRYLWVRPNTSPALIRRDTNDRVIVGFNASVEKEVSLGAS